MNKILLASLLFLVFGFTTVTAQDFEMHQVKSGETVEALARQYAVSPSDIYKLNPDAKKGLKPNTILIIPVSKAQEPKITTVKTLDGFKSHKTRRKETLYGLSKKYNVSEDEIKKYNKFLYSAPLKKGDRLQIPVFKVTHETEETNRVYVVKPKEGKWRIAYKFGISVAELEALNPEMGEVLKEGQEILVPKIAEDDKRLVDERYSYYEVLPKEGFYRLKIKLGLDQEQLELLNPELKETGLKVGMILKIPFSKADSLEDIKAINLSENITDFKEKRIAVMLPFRLNKVDFKSKSNTTKSITNDPYLNASLDFYSGVLLAVDSLKKLGVSLRMDVYDTKFDVNEVSKIIDNGDFKTVDAVIGPLTSNTFEKAATKLKNYNVPIVSPIGLNLKLHDNVFQSRPTNDKLKSAIVHFVKKDSTTNNIVVISDFETHSSFKRRKAGFCSSRTSVFQKE